MKIEAHRDIADSAVDMCLFNAGPVVCAAHQGTMAQHTLLEERNQSLHTIYLESDLPTTALWHVLTQDSRVRCATRLLNSELLNNQPTPPSWLQDINKVILVLVPILVPILPLGKCHATAARMC